MVTDYILPSIQDKQVNLDDRALFYTNLWIKYRVRKTGKLPNQLYTGSYALLTLSPKDAGVSLLTVI